MVQNLDINECKINSVFSRLFDIDADSARKNNFERMGDLKTKRTYDDAFKRRPLDSIQTGDFCVEHTVYKVVRPRAEDFFDVKTDQNRDFSYHASVIKGTSTSGTLYTGTKKATKTELVELFSNLSINDIWHAEFFKLEKEKDWQQELVEKIQSMNKDEAVKLVKKDSATFGKIKREITGQKILLKSSNNYYTVRDLNIYFEDLANTGVELASKNSIRTLDVNTLQSLIFNGVKYILKK